ncbi:MAG: phage tail protein [Pseudomonadota bacterium]
MPVSLSTGGADLRGLRRLAREYPAKVVRPAMVRTVNELTRNATVEARKQVRKERRLKARDIKNTFRIKKAVARDPNAVITALRIPIPLARYGPRQTKRGVTYNATGKRELWRPKPGHSKSFLVPKGAGKAGGHVFTRKPGSKRLPIEKAFGPPVWTRFAEEEVQKALNSLLDSRAEVVFDRNFRFYARRAGFLP